MQCDSRMSFYSVSSMCMETCYVFWRYREEEKHGPGLPKFNLVMQAKPKTVNVDNNSDSNNQHLLSARHCSKHLIF